MAVTYEDGFREAEQLLLSEADGLEQAAMQCDEETPRQVFLGMSLYLKTLVEQLQNRRTFVLQMQGLLVTPTQGEHSDG